MERIPGEVAYSAEKVYTVHHSLDRMLKEKYKYNKKPTRGQNKNGNTATLGEMKVVRLLINVHNNRIYVKNISTA